MTSTFSPLLFSLITIISMMALLFGINCRLVLVAIATILYCSFWSEIRRRRRLAAKVADLKFEILGKSLHNSSTFTSSNSLPAMARGRLWPLYPDGDFAVDIITIPSDIFPCRYSASLVHFFGDERQLVLRHEFTSSSVPGAAEDLLEELTIYVIRNDDEYKRAFVKAISPVSRWGDNERGEEIPLITSTQLFAFIPNHSAIWAKYYRKGSRLGIRWDG